MSRLMDRTALPVLVAVTVAVALAGMVSLVYPSAVSIWMVTAGAFVAYWRSDVMLGLLAMSVPIQTSVVVEVDGSSVTLTKLAIASLAIGWLSHAMRAHVPLDRVTWGYASIVIAVAGSVVAVEDTMQWASTTYQWAAAMFVYIVARTEVKTAGGAKVIIFSMATAVLGVSVYSMTQVLREDGPASFFVNGVLRAYGTFGEPNPLAAYLEMSIPLLLAYLVWSVSTRRSPPANGKHSLLLFLPLAAVVAGTITLVLTQSRGGWIGFSCAAVVISSMLPARWRIAGFGVGACTILVLLQTPIGSGWWSRVMEAFPAAQERAQVTPANWANEERRAHWGAAVRMFLDNPLSGVGAGEFNREFRHHTPEWRFRESRGHAHNGYLQLAAENGLPGLISFIAWCGLVLTALLSKRLKPTSPFELALATGAAATFVAFMVHSMVDYLNVLSLGIQIALVLALGMARFSVQNAAIGGRGLTLGRRIIAWRR